MPENRGLLIVLSGPSGSGKGTMLKEAMAQNQNLELSVSVTTRSPRIGEVDGESYIFASKPQFEEMIKQDGFIEWAQFCENYYGTPRERVEKRLAEGKDVVLEIEVQGAMKVRECFPDAVLIFTLPPSMEVLKNRLVGRQTESQDVIEKRLKTAHWEISMAKHYDYLVINDKIDVAAQEFLAIINGEKCSLKRTLDVLKCYQ